MASKGKKGDAIVYTNFVDGIVTPAVKANVEKGIAAAPAVYGDVLRADKAVIVDIFDDNSADIDITVPTGEVFRREGVPFSEKAARAHWSVKV